MFINYSLVLNLFSLILNELSFILNLLSFILNVKWSRSQIKDYCNIVQAIKKKLIIFQSFYCNN